MQKVEYQSYTFEKWTEMVSSGGILGRHSDSNPHSRNLSIIHWSHVTDVTWHVTANAVAWLREISSGKVTGILSISMVTWSQLVLQHAFRIGWLIIRVFRIRQCITVLEYLVYTVAVYIHWCHTCPRASWWVFAVNKFKKEELLF